VQATLSSPVLVLNANFAPINVCNVRRALGLILADKATLVMNGRGYIHTVNHDLPCPSIIRLAYMVRRPRPQVKLNKQEIFRRDNHTCQYCGSHPQRPTLDHVIPRHLGGEHTWENLVTACPSCNHRKGGRTPDQANMHPFKIPVAPPASADYIFGKYLKSNDEWVEFINGW
jgi:5-methylcytosine-specific restriction endonuclease McrA